MKEMKYGVSGTGDVGHVIASKLIDLEYYAVSDPPNMHVRATRYAI